MPYISTERVKEIRKQIKSEFPDFKFSIRTHHSMEVFVKVISGPIDFETEYEQINQYYIEDHWEELPDARNFLLRLYELMDKGNYTTVVDVDYGNIPKFYTSIQIGSYDKPYQLK